MLPRQPEAWARPDRWHRAGAGAGCPRCSFATRQVSETEDRAADVAAGGWLQRSGQLRRRLGGTYAATWRPIEVVIPTRYLFGTVILLQPKQTSVNRHGK